jgi:hypothetical protein
VLGDAVMFGFDPLSGIPEASALFLRKWQSCMKLFVMAL